MSCPTSHPSVSVQERNQSEHEAFEIDEEGENDSGWETEEDEETETEDEGTILVAAAAELKARFQAEGNTQVLAHSISLLRKASSLHPYGHEQYGETLFQLIEALLLYCKRTEDGEAIDELIGHCSELYQLVPSYHPAYAAVSASLAGGLYLRVVQSGDPDDMRSTITLYREAVKYTPKASGNHALALRGLGDALGMSSEKNGDMNELSESLSLLREALDFWPPDHPERLGTLGDLSSSLARFAEITGDLDSLNEAIGLLKATISITSVSQSEHANVLDKLATLLATKYYQTGDLTLLYEAIEHDRHALLLQPESSAKNSGFFINLATLLGEEFDVSGNDKNLEESIRLAQQAISYLPRGYDARPGGLNALANSLSKRFQQSGNFSDLKEAIELRREAASLVPPGSPHCAELIDSLAFSIVMQFEQSGDISLLNEAIQLHRAALNTLPESHPARGNTLIHAASTLFRRFEQNGDINALNESIEFYHEALRLLPESHSSRPSALSNLAISLSKRAELEKTPEGLVEVIEVCRKALKIASVTNPSYRLSLHNLSTALTLRFEQTKEPGLIVEAIECFQKALELTPQGDPSRPSILQNLAISRLSQFDIVNDEEGLKDALNIMDQVVQERPKGHPQHHTAIFTLAKMRLRKSAYYSCLQALELMSTAIAEYGASARNRLRGAIDSLRWLENATKCDLHENSQSEKALEIYTSVIRLIPRAAHFGLDLATRLRELSGSENLCRVATMRAIRLRHLRVAVELFEEGKSVFWQQALQLRSNALDPLPQADRKELTNIFKILENEDADFSTVKSKAEVEQKIEDRRILNEKAESLISEIRSRPGFERFLMIPDFEELIQVVEDSVIVILVDSSPSYYAILVSNAWSEKARTVDLPRVAPNELAKLTVSIGRPCMRGKQEAQDGTDLGAFSMNETTRGMGISTANGIGPLAKLWHMIVEPVISALGIEAATGWERPRVYWYPSGQFSFLPLHAAGIYGGKNTIGVSDYVVSSYTPSLYALMKARRGSNVISRQDLRCLVLAEPHAPQQVVLHNAEAEAQIVLDLLKSKSIRPYLDDGSAQVTSSVIGCLPDVHILHLCCHGHQDLNPLDSHFALSDGNLTIHSLMKLNVPNAILAFLSACETAKGDRDQPDQAVHLAASLLFCGFRSVVATMWEMYDEDGPRMAQWFYETLLQKETIDLSDIPYALDAAVQRLREMGASPYRWATFMHLGA